MMIPIVVYSCILIYQRVDPIRTAAQSSLGAPGVRSWEVGEGLKEGAFALAKAHYVG